MSQGGNPFDQKRGDRTIIQVSPNRAREPNRQDQQAPPPPDVGRRVEPPRQDAARGGAPQRPIQDNSSEDWIRSQERGPVEQKTSSLPDIDLTDLVSPHDNPIMRAAGPLLLLLGRLRAAVLRAPFGSLMEQVAEAVKFFETEIRAAGVSEDQARAAKYVLCATADDIVQNIPTDDRHEWTRYSMLARFFNERTGGVKFFEEVDRAKLDPMRNYQLLELQYTCLALGFQGMHRHSAGGQSTLQTLQRHLYEILRQVRPRAERELSPHWQGLQLKRNEGWFRVPVWAAWSVAGLLLLGLYAALRMLLTGGAEASIERMRAMHATDPLSIERRVLVEIKPPPPPPPPPQTRLTQIQRIRAALATEIAAGQVDAEQTRSMIVIRVGDLVSFRPSSATVLPQFEPIAARISQVLDKEPRRIKVVGHTDNIPLSSVSRFSSNLELSVERAKAVAGVLRRGLSDPTRIDVAGRADEDPIAPNATKEGRAKNRRVEMSLERDD